MRHELNDLKSGEGRDLRSARGEPLVEGNRAALGDLRPILLRRNSGDEDEQ
jgi:hypothetical protein